MPLETIEENEMYIVELAFGHYRSNGEPLPRHQIETMEHLGLATFAKFLRGVGNDSVVEEVT
jgi:hypothetical protein